jgi:hypothetical protein
LFHREIERILANVNFNEINSLRLKKHFNNLKILRQGDMGVVNGRVMEGQVHTDQKGRTPCRPNCVNDLRKKSNPIRKRATIIIRAVIGGR